jgi:hypothetical protein
MLHKAAYSHPMRDSCLFGHYAGGVRNPPRVRCETRLELIERNAGGVMLNPSCVAFSSEVGSFRPP